MSVKLLLTSLSSGGGGNYWVAEHEPNVAASTMPLPIIDSSDNIYSIDSSNTSATYFFNKFNSTGVLQWSKEFDSNQLGNTYPYLAISSTDLIKISNVESAQFLTCNTSGVIQNQTDFVQNRQDSYSIFGGTNLYTMSWDSTNNIPWFIKYSSTGTTTFGRSITFGTNDSAYSIDAALDTSFNYYLGLVNTKQDTFETTLHYVKWNSSGTYQSQLRVIPVTNCVPTTMALTTDSTNQVYFAVPYTDFNNNQETFITLLKLNAGSIVWQRKIPSMATSYVQITCDSSNNIYVVGKNTTDTDIKIVKYNSSGVMQWSRKFSITGYTYLFFIGSICVKNNYLILTTYGLIDSAMVPLIYKYPTDGSITGTFGKFVITSESTADSSDSMTVSSTATFTSNIVSGLFGATSTASFTDITLNLTTTTLG